MKKTILSTVAFCALIFAGNAQVSNFDPTNAREGESVEYCRTHVLEAELKNNPAAAAVFEQDKQIRQAEAASGQTTTKGTIYYIPVVFHVLHNNGVENISDDQILDALDILNRDYALQNVDAANVVSEFNASNPNATVTPTNVEIQFRLATISPGNNYSDCFSGITRTVNAITDNGSNGNAQVDAIIAGNDVYNGQFPGDKYLNIFICGDIGGAAGYTYRPNNWIGTNMKNGIWVLHNYVGSIGTSSTYTSRTLTHEVGHWLGLPHPWGGTNNPGLSSNCSTDDTDDEPLIYDTPNTLGSTSCNLTEQTCGPLANVENYMDYSYCSKMFTPGQVYAMRTIVNSNVANRDNVISSSNLSLVGATGNPTLCKAEFTANRTSVCVGDQITFDDMTYNSVNGWNWTFAGGTPATSTAQNPTVTYNTPGLYTVTLEATDGSSTDTETKTSYIRVLPNPRAIPFIEGFEAYSTLNNIEEWEIYNPAGNGFELSTTVGQNSSKSARLMNYGQSAGNTDELISAPVDLSVLSSTDDVTLSFRYAYARRYTTNDEWLKVFVTGDCGDAWSQRKTIHGPLLGSNTVASSYTPSAGDWVTVHVTNILSTHYTDMFRYKFEFESDGGNNFYIDNINIYEGPASNELVNVVENGLEIDGLSVYPNPTENDLNVRFSVANAQNAELYVRDLSGKVVQSTTVQAAAGTNLVMMGTDKLAQGMYFLNIKVGASEQTVQFIVK